MELVAEIPDLERAVKLTSSGFVQPITPALTEDVEHHIHGDLVWRMVEGDQDIGFATFTFYPDLLYLEGVMLDGGHQGRSYARMAIEAARQLHRVPYFGLQTQNPRMWSVGRAICSAWLPTHDGSEHPGLLAVAEDLAARRGYETLLRPGCYGAPLYGEKPEHRDPRIQQWWDGICDFWRGDAVVCVGRF